jgi:hypothetical protein
LKSFLSVFISIDSLSSPDVTIVNCIQIDVTEHGGLLLRGTCSFLSCPISKLCSLWLERHTAVARYIQRS